MKKKKKEQSRAHTINLESDKSFPMLNDLVSKVRNMEGKLLGTNGIPLIPKRGNRVDTDEVVWRVLLLMMVLARQ